MAAGRRRKHPELTPDVLRAMAGSGHQAYLLAAATHPLTPDDALFDIVDGEQKRSLTVIQHGFWQASVAVAGRRRLPDAALIVLGSHHEREVVEALFDRPSLPGWLLRALSGRVDAWRRMLVAGHPQCPADVLSELATDDSAAVRAAVSENENASEETRAFAAMSV